MPKLPEKFYEGITLALILLFLSFWMSVGLTVWVAIYHPDKQGLFAWVSGFGTGFGAAVLTVLNASGGQKNTTITGKESNIMIEQTGPVAAHAEESRPS